MNDVGPGETSSLKIKWISADSRTVYLVFSGDDCFSVSQGKPVFTRLTFQRHMTRPTKRLQYESVNRLHGYLKPR